MLIVLLFSHNQLSVNICWAVGLALASIFNILNNNDFAPAGTWSGIVNNPLYIFLYNSLSFVPLKGKHPHNIANNNIPEAHISTGGPQYSFLATISGDIYDGVPQNILIRLSLGIHVEKPKSIILILSWSSNKIFSSFISRCVIDLLWH